MIAQVLSAADEKGCSMVRNTLVSASGALASCASTSTESWNSAYVDLVGHGEFSAAEAIARALVGSASSPAERARAWSWVGHANQLQGKPDEALLAFRAAEVEVADAFGALETGRAMMILGLPAPDVFAKLQSVLGMGGLDGFTYHTCHQLLAELALGQGDVTAVGVHLNASLDGCLADRSMMLGPSTALLRTLIEKRLRHVLVAGYAERVVAWLEARGPADRLEEANGLMRVAMTLMGDA